MKQAVIYARVSSKEQEREGYSIPAQLKLLEEYAARQNIKIVKGYTESETAKAEGRENFLRMVKFLKSNKAVKTILVEKTDRLYRNFKDYVLLDDIKGLEIHLVKENSILSENSRSHDKFIHGVKVLMAKNYIDNLSEEIRKGLNEKAEQGNYPIRPPYGYKRTDAKTIVLDPDKAPYIRRAFELYSKGDISLDRLANKLQDEGYIYRPSMPKVKKSQLESLLKNPFYTGQFIYRQRLYQGNHPPLITHELFEATQRAFRKDNKPETMTANRFLFSGLLTCGECGCSIVGELKKGRYIYYRCTGRRGPCPQTKYVKQEIIEEQMQAIVSRVNMTPEHKELISTALKESFSEVQTYHKERLAQLRKEELRLEARLEALYTDKLDGAISEEFWLKNHNKFNLDLSKTQAAIKNHQAANKNYMEAGNRLLEQAKDAHSKYIRMSPEDKANFLKTLCSNFLLKDGKLDPTYEEPFGVFAEGLSRTLKWCLVDKVRTFLLEAA